MNRLKDDKVEKIIEISKELFLEKGIINVTVKDIALGAGCGEATIYRRYKTKNNLAILAGASLASSVLNKYTFDSKSSGYEMLSRFYHAYSDVFVDDIRYYRFIDELDRILQGDSSGEKKEYEDIIGAYFSLYKEIYSRGILDGSLKEVPDLSLLYYSTTHSVLSLCKKLSASEDILSQDSLSDKVSEINTLIDIILAYIKK